ncbi:MAG: flavodoxin family protein [Actinobacteria bacterium]|nr:flavodoxin family protein [Actinomycetota bacterium]
MKVIGVSGSPIKNSNTDRAVKAVLEATGLETEFVKLFDYTIAPCKACLGCVKTNRCVIKDDGIEMAEKVKAADALVVGGFTPYSSLDARTKAFLERLYPLRHRNGFLRGKPVAAVVTSATPQGVEGLPPAADMGVNAIQFAAMEEGMDFVGSVVMAGNVPCVKCQFREECPMNGIKMIHGPEATLESVGISCFEDQETVVKSTQELGRAIREKLLA